MAAEELPSYSGNSKLCEQDFNLLAQANDEFEKSEYDICLQTLDQLMNSMGNNAKIRHNRAIVQFYKSDCKNHDNLLSNLEELTTNEPDETKSIAVISEDTSLSPVGIYNKAVIYYYKRKFNMAIDTLSPLVEKINDLDESTSMLIVILMLNVLIETNQITRAQRLIELMKIQLGLSIEECCAEDSIPPERLADKEALNQQFKYMWMLTNVLNKTSTDVVDDGSLEMSTLKARQFYMLNNFQMAAKQLKKISESSFTLDSRVDLDTCISNNMGIIHLRMRHYAIAAKFFQNAITLDKVMATNLHKAALQQLGGVRTREILYNLGIAMLHLRRAKEAFQCFLIPLKTYHSNPRLWLRVAESCIMDYEMKCAEKEKDPIIYSGAGVGNYKRIISKMTTMLKIKGDPTTMSEPSLEFAVLCLRSALTLATVYRTQFSTIANEENQNWSNINDANFCNPSMSISRESLDKMISAIYAAYSYVSLRIGDYVTAHELAQELLKIEQLSDSYKMLGHMYAGEALIMMDRWAEARPHLEPSLISTLNVNDFETQIWNVKSLDAAEAIVRYNLVIAMLLHGDYKLAKDMLCSCTHPIVASKVRDLKSYLDMTTM